MFWVYAIFKIYSIFNFVISTIEIFNFGNFQFLRLSTLGIFYFLNIQFIKTIDFSKILISNKIFITNPYEEEEQENINCMNLVIKKCMPEIIDFITFGIQFFFLTSSCAPCIFCTIMCHNDELSSAMSWIDCLLTDSELFISFTENSQILLKIYVIPILLTFSYLVATNLLVNNELNSSLWHIIFTFDIPKLVYLLMDCSCVTVV